MKYIIYRETIKREDVSIFLDQNKIEIMEGEIGGYKYIRAVLTEEEAMVLKLTIPGLKLFNYLDES